MKKTNKKNIVATIFNIFLLLFYATNIAYADITVPGEVQERLVEITRILLLIGTAVCIGKLIHIGILYVTSTAAERSNAKQAVLPWIIGTVVCFGAATIGEWIINLFLGLLPNKVLDY